MQAESDFWACARSYGGRAASRAPHTLALDDSARRSVASIPFHSSSSGLMPYREKMQRGHGRLVAELTRG